MRLEIDQELCIQCGQCARDCPARAIQREGEDGPYRIHPGLCIECSHCACVCPEHAVTSDQGPFEPWQDPKLTPEVARAFLAGKRSVRQYTPEPVSREILEAMLDVGSLTATASNLQDWNAVILTGAAIPPLRDEVMAFFTRLYNLVKHSFVQALVKLVPAGRRLLDDEYAVEKLRLFVEEWQGGDDPLFFGAPVVILLTAEKKNLFGRTNCVLAGAAMQYYLQAHDVGTTMIGFAEQALARKKKLRARCHVPDDHRVHLVFTVGHAKVHYRRLPRRAAMPVEFVSEL